MEIQLKQLRFRNFKKLRDLTLDFDPKMNNILGANGVGKTSVLDGFNWLLFGKNSENKADFSIKTLDAENKAIPKLEHEVTGILVVDGKEVKLTRIYKEKYTKKRGSALEEFSGHIQEFFIDDVPMKESEYNSYVSSLFGVDFRLLTDCKYFNEVMKWEDRRRVLIDMGGNVSYSEIIQENPTLNLVADLLAKNERSIEEQRKVLTAKKTKLKESLETIPARLDELDRQLSHDLIPIQELESQKRNLTDEIQTFRRAISDTVEKQSQLNRQNEFVMKRRGQINIEIQQIEQDLSTERKNRENELNDEIQGLKNILTKHEKQKTFLLSQIEQYSSNIDDLKKQSDELKVEYEDENKKTFDFNSLNCSSCGQSLPKSNQESLLTAFNQGKSININRIINSANNIKKRVDGLKLDVEENQKELNTTIELIQSTTNQLNEKQATLEAFNNEVFEIKSDEIEVLELELGTLTIQKSEIDNSEFEAKIQENETKIQEIQKELSKHDQNENIKKRQAELIAQRDTLAKEFEEVELFEYQIQVFNKAFITKIENNINSMFKVVKFKMFEEQINGGERPICVCMIDGVPYPDLNRASQVNAGLDIITTLQLNRRLIAPIFIDNRESVTKIIPTQAQVINLIVDSSQKQLVIK